MRIGSEVIDWSSEAADRLASALLLTENEQKFALVRAVLHLKNLNHVHGTLVPAFSFMGLYTAAQYVNYRFNLLSKSPFVSALDLNGFRTKKNKLNIHSNSFRFHFS